MRLFRVLGLCVLALSSVPLLGAERAISWSLFPNETAANATQVERGRIEFQNACAVCHGAGGDDKAGTRSLAVKYQGKTPALLEERTDLTAPVVLYFIRNGVGMMAFYRKTELSDAQASAIAAYLSRKR
jgi:mono/diheme cytochrome c family protein